MNVTTIGRGNIGGGLAKLWEKAGHDVTTLGSEGGDASGADVVLVAVPSGAISDALSKVTEQLIRDAGYEPVSAGGLENARALEDFVPNLLGKIGRVFYRFAPPGEL